MWSYKVVTNYTFFILSSVICCIVHTTFAINQNCFRSSLPIPLKIKIFIMFDMMNGGGGGRSVDEGVCSGSGGGGGVDGWDILGIHWFINWTTLCGVVNIAPSSSLEGGLINGLYSGPDPLLLKNLSLRVALNIKVMELPTFHIITF